MLNRIIFLSLFLTFFCTGGFAQNGRLYSLEECIEIGLKNNSDFKTANYEVNRAGANVRGSYATILPRLDLNLSSDRSTAGKSVNSRSIPVTDPATGEPVIDPETGEQIFDRRVTTQPKVTFDNHGLTLSFSQTLFDFGRNWNSIGQAKSSFNASSQSLVAARQNVHMVVKQRYLELLKALKLEQEYDEAVVRSRDQLSRTQSMYEIGSVAQIDVYRQEVILGGDEINAINQKTIVEIARGNLNVAMGRDPDTEIAIGDIDAQEFNPDFSLEEAIDTAEKNNPDLKRFEYDMNSANHGKKIARTAYLPAITFAGFYNRDNEKFDKVYGEFGENYFFRVGFDVDLNIFNGFSDAAEFSRQSAGYSIAKENWIAQSRQIRLNVKQAYLNLQAYNKISDINERNLRSAGEDYRLAQERYRVGAGTQLEVTDAQVSLTRARVNLVRAKYDALIAQAQLQAAMGTIEDESK